MQGVARALCPDGRRQTAPDLIKRELRSGRSGRVGSVSGTPKLPVSSTLPSIIRSMAVVFEAITHVIAGTHRSTSHLDLPRLPCRVKHGEMPCLDLHGGGRVHCRAAEFKQTG